MEFTTASFTTVVHDLAAGNHTIEIQATPGFGAQIWRIDDLSLVVTTHD